MTTPTSPKRAGPSEAFTLDQLRTFVAVHEAGNFSAAARRLGRAQSAVSAAMATLEEELGVTLWDRSTRIPTLTEHGEAMLAAARRALAEIDAMRSLASDLNGGMEARVSLCVDALFPVGALVDLAKAFAREFPHVDLRVDSQTMSAVSEVVLEGAATLGVVSPLGLRPELERRPLAPIQMVSVVGPSHPLAQRSDLVPTSAFADCVQIVLSERHGGAGVPDQGVLSPRTWRVTDLYTKRTMIRAGVGWGNLPDHFIRDDLSARRLVAIRPAAWGEHEHRLTLSLVYRRDMTFGRAHRWLMAALQELCLDGDEATSRAATNATTPTGNSTS